MHVIQEIAVLYQDVPVFKAVHLEPSICNPGKNQSDIVLSSARLGQLQDVGLQNCMLPVRIFAGR